MKFEEFQVFTRFPFGLFSKALRISSAETALVYPEIEPVRPAMIFNDARGAGELTPSPVGVGSDAVGLRNYAVGDPVRRVHWRASIRKRELLVREIENERDAEIEIWLRTANRTAGDVFEQAVRSAASEICALIECGMRVSLRTDGQRIGAGAGPRQRARLLSVLALIGPNDGMIDAVTAAKASASGAAAA